MEKCRYCGRSGIQEPRNIALYNGRNITSFIEDGKIVILQYDSIYGGRNMNFISIKYCPMCGRKLE